MILSEDYIKASDDKIPERDNIDRSSNNLEGFALDASVMRNSVASQGSYTDTKVNHVILVRDNDFAENFIFYKLWIDDIDLEAITTTHNREFAVWSTFRDNRYISSVDVTNPSNTQLVESPNINLAPTEEKILNLFVNVYGPVQVEANYLFTLDNLYSMDIDVTGYRVIVLSYPPQVPISDRMTWLTNIMTSYNDTEQRVMLRENSRVTVSFSLLQLTHEESSDLRTKIMGCLGNWWAVPMWHEQRMVSQEVEVDDVEVFVDTKYGDFNIGWRAIIWESATNFEVIKVSVINEFSLELSVPMATSFGKSAIVMPVHIGMPQDKISNLVHNVGLDSPSFEFDLLDTNDFSGYVPSTEYRSIPVLESRNVTFSKRSVRQDISRLLDRVDFEQGMFEVQNRGETKLGNSLGMHSNSLKDIYETKQLLAYLKGRLKPIWLLSWTHDIILSEPFHDYDDTLHLNNESYFKYINMKERRRDLAFVEVNGNIFYRRIVDSTESTITIDSPIGVNGDMSSFKLICFLQLSRLSADSIEMVHSRAGQSKLQVNTEMTKE